MTHIAELAGILVLSSIFVRIARWGALKRILVDVPNERSMHRQPVPRLGGAAFVPIVVLAIAFLSDRSAISPAIFRIFLLGAIALFGIGLFDDVASQPPGFRMAVHLMVAGSIVWAVAISTGFRWAWLPPLSALSLSFWLLIFWIIGLVNIFNFMDGIDGIAGMQAVVAGAGWWIIGSIVSAPFTAFVGAAIAFGSLGFLTLNWPPAKIFMGDAGSTVLGYLLATLPLLATVESKGVFPAELLMAAAVMAVWPFLADGTFTILRRLMRRENIFKPHRSHLYQRLVAAGKSHRLVTCTYASLALLGSLFALGLVRQMPFALVASLVFLGIAFCLLWGWTVRSEKSCEVDR